MSSPERILIAGGGIAGLTLSIALRRRGIPCELVERSPTWEAPGAGILLHANGMRVLRDLGVGAGVELEGALAHSWEFSDGAGNPLFEVDLDDLWNGLGSSVGIARPALHRLLLSHSPYAAFHRGRAVVSLTQHQTHVSVGFDNGASDDYELVVGADGIGSTLRQLAFRGSTIGYTGMMDWRSLAPIRIPGLRGLKVLLGDHQLFGLLPVGNHKTYGFGIEHRDRLRDPVEGRLGRFRERFAAFGGPVDDYLSALKSDGEIHCGPIEWVELNRWHLGRLVVIGDAAHAGPPTMAQGGAMAMEDAWVLADVLDGASTVDEALAEFVVRRRPRVDWVGQQSRSVARSLLLAPAERDPMFRSQGGRAMYGRFKPLLSAP